MKAGYLNRNTFRLVDVFYSLNIDIAKVCKNLIILDCKNIKKKLSKSAERADIKTRCFAGLCLIECVEFVLLLFRSYQPQKLQQEKNVTATARSHNNKNMLQLQQDAMTTSRRYRKNIKIQQKEEARETTRCYNKSRTLHQQHLKRSNYKNNVSPQQQ